MPLSLDQHRFDFFETDDKINLNHKTFYNIFLFSPTNDFLFRPFFCIRSSQVFHIKKIKSEKKKPKPRARLMLAEERKASPKL